ncbi:MAG: radical SAM protein [Myxococcales bacterium]|nr:radical SAM protein [Myxococcales bacterium]
MLAERAPFVLLARVAAKAWHDRANGHGVRRALLELAFIETARATFGSGGMFTEGASFYPLPLLPDFHGPHFHEAVRRLVLPSAGPFVVHLAITGACPSRGHYCHASAGGPEPPDLGDERLVAIARALVAEAVPLVILAGGEPMARFERLVRLVEVLAVGSEVRVTTSGVGVTAERALCLQRAGLKVMAVSLDGDDRRRVDATRGLDGAFAAAVAALGHAAAAGLITFVTTVVARDAFGSSGEVDRFLAFVRSVHPTAVVNFVPQFATGRGTATGFRSPAEYRPVARRIAASIRRGGHRATVFRAPLELAVGCVGGGLRQIHIDTRGNVAACVSGATFGNLEDEPLGAIAARMRALRPRLKRGFLCATVAARASARVLDPEASKQALAAFYATHEDTLFQRLLDVAEPVVDWLVRQEPAGGRLRRAILHGMGGDTSEEAARILRERTLQKTESERLEQGIQLSLFARQAMRAGIRARHPDYTAAEVEQALARILWGDALYHAARPDWPLLDP